MLGYRGSNDIHCSSEALNCSVSLDNASSSPSRLENILSYVHPCISKGIKVDLLSGITGTKERAKAALESLGTPYVTAVFGFLNHRFEWYKPISKTFAIVKG